MIRFLISQYRNFLLIYFHLSNLYNNLTRSVYICTVERISCASIVKFNMMIMFLSATVSHSGFICKTRSVSIYAGPQRRIFLSLYICEFVAFIVPYQVGVDIFHL